MFFVGLDIGTSYIRVALGEINEDEKLKIIGIASKKSEGLRNGVIVNIEDASRVIREVIEEAEQKAGVDVESCTIGIGGAQIEGINQSGKTAVSQPGKALREVTRADIDMAVNNACAVFIPQDRELLHVVPQSYTVDGQKDIPDPLNMICTGLEAEVHVITASKTTIKNVKRCVERAAYKCEGVMLKTLAATKAVVQNDEMDIGSILIDLGAGTTDVLVLLGGAPICTISIPVGGNLVTSDIAIVKGIPISVAEKIKIESGCCFIDNIADDIEVIIPGVGGADPECTTQAEICQIIQPRVEEIFLMVKQAVVHNTNVKQLSGNIILTGGGSKMDGIIECAQYIFGTRAVRIGMPEKLGGNEKEYRTPDFATAVGLVLATKETIEKKSSRKTFLDESGKKDNIFQRLKKSFF